MINGCRIVIDLTGNGRALIETLTSICPGATEYNRGISQSAQLVYKPTFEPSNSQTEA
jgi:hypothetical protein